MSDMQLRRNDLDLQRRMRSQEAKSLGPTLGEFVSTPLGIHRLRAYWPFSSFTETPTAIDLSGQARTLTFNGTVNISAYGDFVPYLDFNGTTGYLSRPDEAGLRITGTLTFGGWFWADTGAAIAGLFSKFGNVIADQSYMLRYTGSNTVQFQIGDGVAVKSVTSTVAFTNAAWHYVVGRYRPSAEIAIFVDGVKTVNTTTIPGALVAGAAVLNLGRLNAVNGQYLDGRIAQPFLSAAALSDTYINYLFNRSRVLFGV